MLLCWNKTLHLLVSLKRILTNIFYILGKRVSFGKFRLKTYNHQMLFMGMILPTISHGGNMFWSHFWLLSKFLCILLPMSLLKFLVGNVFFQHLTLQSYSIALNNFALNSNAKKILFNERMCCPTLSCDFIMSSS